MQDSLLQPAFIYVSEEKCEDTCERLPDQFYVTEQASSLQYSAFRTAVFVTARFQFRLTSV